MMSAGDVVTEEHLDGFKYNFPTQQVLLFAAGSGIVPIKAAWKVKFYPTVRVFRLLKVNHSRV